MTLLTLLLTCLITTGSPAVHAWRWPLGPPAPRVLRAFSPPAAPWGPGHRGVDLAARPGQPVYSAGSGRVSYAGRLAGRGVVAVDHGPLRTTYLPVRPSVPAGRQVSPGSRIGVLEDGHRHCATPCLHWGLLRSSVYLDPLTLVRREVRLLPQWPDTVPAPASREHERHAPPAPPPSPSMTLRDASTATGGAVTGLLLAYSLAFVRRRTRSRIRSRRPPPNVIDLAQERRLRRVPQRRRERT